MKKLKVIITILLVVSCTQIAKNIYLYAQYKHGTCTFSKKSGVKDSLIGEWEGVFDTWVEGIDERYSIGYKFSSDSTGIFQYSYFRNKTDGRPAETYSWRALLKYSRDDVYTYETNILFDDEYIIYLPNGHSSWTDTVYSRYNVVANSLYVDKDKSQSRYDRKPNWCFASSSKVSFFKLLQFWRL